MFITIGEILKAQGISGEVKVKPLTDDISRFKKLKKVFIAGKELDVLSVRINDGFVFLKLGGISDRNNAQLLTGKMLEIDRAGAVELPKDAYFIADVIGCLVRLSDGTFVGKVDYVYQNGAADVFEVIGEKNVMFPFLNDLIISVDLTEKIIVLDKNEFQKVAVYED